MNKTIGYAILCWQHWLCPCGVSRLHDEAAVLCCFACAFNLLLGYTGLLSFGHAAFLGGAGYITVAGS